MSICSSTFLHIACSCSTRETTINSYAYTTTATNIKNCNVAALCASNQSSTPHFNLHQKRNRSMLYESPDAAAPRFNTRSSEVGILANGIVADWICTWAPDQLHLCGSHQSTFSMQPPIWWWRLSDDYVHHDSEAWDLHIADLSQCVIHSSLSYLCLLLEISRLEKAYRLRILSLIKFWNELGSLSNSLKPDIPIF